MACCVYVGCRNRGVSSTSLAAPVHAVLSNTKRGSGGGCGSGGSFGASSPVRVQCFSKPQDVITAEMEVVLEKLAAKAALGWQ